MVQVKLSVKPDPRTQEVLENLSLEVRKKFDMVQSPFLETIFETQRRALNNFLPIQNSIAQFSKAFAPSLAMIKLINNFPRITSPVFKRERFHMPPPVRPLSANDIADLVVEKLSAKNPVQKKNIAQPEDSPAAKLPQDKNMANLELRFNGPSMIDMWYAGRHIGEYDYISLGMCRRNTNPVKPDNQWELLQQLATIFEFGGKLFVPTISNFASHLKMSEDQVAKRMSLLSKKLSTALGMTENPFHPYSKDKGYRPKFKLRPVVALRGDGELHRSAGIYRDDLTGEEPEYEI